MSSVLDWLKNKYGQAKSFVQQNKYESPASFLIKKYTPQVRQAAQPVVQRARQFVAPTMTKVIRPALNFAKQNYKVSPIQMINRKYNAPQIVQSAADIINPFTTKRGLKKLDLSTRPIQKFLVESNVAKQYTDTMQEAQKQGYRGVLDPRIKENPELAQKQKIAIGNILDIGGVKKVGRKIAGKAIKALKPGEVGGVGKVAKPTQKLVVKKPTGAGINELKISTKPSKTPIMNQASDFISRTKTALLNRFDPIEKVVQGKKLAPSANPAVLLKRMSGGMGIANAKIDYDLTPIIKQTNKFDDLRKFLVAERMNELSARGIGQRADKALSEIRTKVGEQEFGNFQNIAKQLYGYQRKFIDEMKDLGIFSDDVYKKITSNNEKYVPFQRLMDDLDQTGFIGSTKNINLMSSGIKKIKGSERAIIDPIESMIKNTYDLQKTIEKQRTLKALVDLGEFKKIKTKFAPVAKTGEETIFRPSKFEPTEPHITLFEDGKKVYYSTSKEIADAVKGINEESLNLAIKAMSLPAKTLRAGATGLNVGFAVPNLLRDQLSAAVNSKYGGIPIYDFISGLGSVMKRGDVYKRWLLSGADQAAFFSQERTTLQRGVKNITNPWLARAKTVLNPLELLRVVGEFSEKGSRLGVFKRALKGAGKEGLTGFNKELAAMEQAREATIDFARRGSKMKSLNAIIPFLNARIQGTAKLMQSFKQRPIQSLAIGGGIAGVPAAVLYFHNKQYPEYNEIPDYIKNNNFIIMTGNQDTPFIKIPKGEIGQVFANPLENFLDFAYKTEDKQSFAQMAWQVLSQLSPVQGAGDIIPTAAKVPLELLANYDTFKKQNIVNKYQTDLPPAMQYNKDTSETAKRIGGKLNISPAKLQHTITGLTAGVGKQTLQLADMALGKFPNKQNLPVVDRFLGESKDLSKSFSNLWKKDNKQTASNVIEHEGKYYTKIDGSVRNFDTPQEAQFAIVKNDFEKSSKNIAFVGDVVFRKSAGGYISTQTRPQYDASLSYQQMMTAKKANNITDYLKYAEQNYNAMQKQLQDPNIDPLDKATLESRIATLVGYVQKYSSYGGFKKGSSGRRGGSRKAKKPKGFTAPKLAFKAPKSAKTAKATIKIQAKVGKASPKKTKLKAFRAKRMV